MTFRPAPRAALWIASVLFVAACNGDGTGPGGRLIRGTFTGTLSATAVRQLDGDATSEEDEGEGQDAIILTANEGTENEVAIVLVHLNGAFGEGRESVADGFDNAVTRGVVGAIFLGPVGDIWYFSTDGRVDVDDVGSAGITGSARFDALDYDLGTSEPGDTEITVDVDFKTRFVQPQTSASAPRASLSPSMQRRVRTFLDRHR